MAGMTTDDVKRFVFDEIGALEERVVDAIALAVRMGLRQQPQTGTTVGYGTVVAAGPPVDVQLDIDQSIIASYSLGAVTVGDRVAILYTPPSGSLVLGAPATVVAPPVIDDWKVYLDIDDPDALRMLLASALNDATVRMERLIVTYRTPSGVGVLTANMDVPNAYAINLPNLGDIGAKRADPTSGDYELISAGPDDSVLIGATDFAGQIVRLFGQIDMLNAHGFLWPAMTTAQRDLLTGVVPAMAIFNTTDGKYQGRMPDNTWKNFVMADIAGPPPAALYPSDTQYPANTLYPNG